MLARRQPKVIMTVRISPLLKDELEAFAKAHGVTVSRAVSYCVGKKVKQWKSKSADKPRTPANGR